MSTSSPYEGAGPRNSSTPKAVLLVEEIRQLLIRSGMHLDVMIADQPFGVVVDSCLRNGVELIAQRPGHTPGQMGVPPDRPDRHNPVEA